MSEDTFDYSQLSDEQLQAIASGQPAPQAPPGDLGLPQSVVDTVQQAGSMADTAYQGGLQGIRNFQVGGGLLLRDITDALGMTSKEGSDSIRQANAADNQQTDLAAEQAGNPGINSVSKLAGELIPNIALSGGASSLAKGVASKGILGGAVGGALPDSGDLAGRAENTAMGGVLGGALAKGGELIANRTKFVADPVKQEYFRTLGIDPRASQVAVDPKVANSMAWVEGKLAKLPLGSIGSPGSVAKQIDAYSTNVPKIINELDGTLEGPPSRQLFATAVDNPVVAARFHDPANLQAVGQNLSDSLTPYGNKISDYAKNILKDATDGTPMNMGQLQKLREKVSNHIGDLLKDTTTSTEEMKAMRTFRSSLSDELQTLAKQNGVLPEWLQGNKRWMQEQAVKEIQVGLGKSYEAAGSAENGDKFLPNAFRTNLNKAMKNLKEDNFTPTGQLKDTIKGIQKIGAQILGKDSPKAINTNAPFSLGDAIKGAIGGGAGIGAAHVVGTLPAAGLAGAGWTITKGLQMLLQSPTGLEILAKAGRAGNTSSAMRQAVVSAFSVGHASILHEASKINEQPDSFDYSKLSDEQLKAISAGQDPTNAAPQEGQP